MPLSDVKLTKEFKENYIRDTAHELHITDKTVILTALKQFENWDETDSLDHFMEASKDVLDFLKYARENPEDDIGCKPIEWITVQ